MPAITVNSSDTFEQWRVKTNQIASNVDNLLTGSGNIIANNTYNALYIEQSGTGNAILIADTGAPDSTPFVIKNDGNVGIGYANPAYALDINGTSNVSRLISTTANVTDATITTVRSTTGFITGTTQSTSTTTGALQVSGGAGIAANLYVGGNVRTTAALISTTANVTDATITTVRSTTANVTDATITTVRSTTGLISGTTQSTSTTTGALQVSGGAGIAANLYVGGNIKATGSILGSDAVYTGAVTATTFYGPITGAITPIDGEIVANVTSTGTSNFNTVVINTTNTTDALRVTQIGTGNALYVGDDTYPDTRPFLIDKEGNVGIGLTNPIAKVDIIDTLGSTRDHTRPILNLYSSASTGNMLVIRNSSLTSNVFALRVDGFGRFIWGANLTVGPGPFTMKSHDGTYRAGRLNTYSENAFENAHIIDALYSTSTGAPTFSFAKSANNSAGGHGVVTTSHSLGAIHFHGSDGNTFQVASRIVGTVDAAVPAAANTVPGGISFETSTSESNVLTRRMYLDSYGNLLLPLGTLKLGSDFGEQLRIERNTDQYLIITNNEVVGPAGPTITSYTSPLSSKQIHFDSTTDSNDSVITAGTLGYNFNIRGTTAIQITQDTTQQNVFNVLSTVGNSIFYATTQSTSTTTGALQVRGGVGIAANLYVGGNVDVNATLDATRLISTTANVTDATITTVRSTTGIVTGTTQSTSTTTGALQVSGGAGIAANLYVGGNVRATNSVISTTANVTDATIATIRSTTGVIGTVQATSTTQSTSTTTGALQVSGGAGIAANLYVGGNVDVNATLDATRLISTTANVTDATITTVRSTTGLVTGTTQSTSTTTGALQVSGGAGIAANLYVGGNVRATNSVISTTANVTDATITTVRSTTGVIGTVQATATTQSTSTSTGALQVSGGAGIAANLYVGGNARITSTTQSTSTATGALQVSGGAGIGGNLYVGGNLRVTDSASILPTNYADYALKIVPTTSASFAAQDGIYVYQPIFGGTGPSYNSFLAFNINESGGLYANPVNGSSTTTESLTFLTNGGSIKLGVTSNYINFTSGGNANFLTDYVHFTLTNDLTVTADNAIINGNLAVRSGLIFRRQGPETGQNGSITLTAGNLLSQVYKVTPSTAINLTLPTGNTLQEVTEMASNESFDWAVINDGTNRATLLANTNHTISGNANVLNGTSGLFRSRRTGSANIYVTYRLA